MPLDESLASSSCNGIPSSPFFPPNYILQMQTPHEEHRTPLLLSSHNNPHEFSRGMVTVMGRGRSSVSFSGNAEDCDREEELSDECSPLGDKKRRLSMEQVRTLEKNFELGNKLEPERKMQLARALGLQPRQVAIWFQNRRARWKTKQLEKDYDLLKRRLDAIKADNDALLSQNKKLQAEIYALKGGREAPELINLNKETEGSCSNRSENSSEINLDVPRALAAGSGPESRLTPIQGISLFPALIRQPPLAAASPQFLHGASKLNLQCTGKAEHGIPGAVDENFGNLLCGMEDQNAFWTWP